MPAQETGTPPNQKKSILGLRELYDGLRQLRSSDDGNSSGRDRLATLRSAVQGTISGDVLEQLLGSDSLETLGRDAAKNLLAGGWSVLSTGISAFLAAATLLVLVALYLVFLLLDYQAYTQTWHEYLPPNYRDPIVKFLEEFDRVLRRYLRGQAVIALATGVLFAIGFSIIGLPLAVPFGLAVGALNMVPYLQAVAILPAVLLASLRALQGEASLLGSVVLVLLVMGMVQLIQDAVLTPRIMGKATGLKPVAILLGVFVWGKLLGLLGLLLAIPLTCVGIAYYRRVVLKHANEQTRVAAPPP